MADIHVSMSLRMRLYLVTLKEEVERVFILSTVTQRIFNCVFSRYGDVKYYGLFSVLHDRFVRDDFFENIVFRVG